MKNHKTTKPQNHKTTFSKFSKAGSYCLLVLILLSALDVFADAEARRRNRCGANDRKYIIRHVRVNGPGPGCPRQVEEDKNCQQRGVEERVENFVIGNCGCTMVFSPGVTNGAVAWAISNPNRLGQFSNVMTSCRGFRAGSDMLYSSNTNTPDAYSIAIINKATLQATTEVYDYQNNQYTINGFNGELHISAPNLFNHFAIIRVEIVKINTDINGNETDEILASSQAKIINGQFIAPTQGSFFSQNDFTITQSSDEIHASFSFESKTINLNYDITENMDIEVRFIGDAGNLENGESEVEVDPVTLTVSSANSQATFQLLSDVARNGTLSVRNATGTLLWSQSGISLSPNDPSQFTYTNSSTTFSPFYVVQFVSSDGIIVLRKFIL